mmetsp:Transcript_22623/g.46378  ORF Transcript_22623/g.46378 Transcript_22623/m.46378 type:complete len:223 (-) Transcript_22623:273-941(-)|eukprot:CAMPEP_0171635298 /NCGR_PEP_ID=MMETSP0990-20121206/26574_1 /TAXON_ID=483369 /ORGANISM="non described non described, Strain CCMP2098" /LENGTH=222 /DNA_ID=CAMNT_0012206897 /DNA_START=79 /DNA_END=747 /DNA_ORIENTATION=+
MASAVPWFARSRTIVCIGRNYKAHAKELNNKVPTKPFWFLKPPSALIPSGTASECAPGRLETHHELELGVVIGTRCRRVTPEKAMEHVAGYCLALDMTDREGQEEAKKQSKPWTACKGWDTSLPVSDFIPASKVPDYKELHMWLKVNGEAEPRQHGSPTNMIFDLPTLLSAVSFYHTLEPGDLLLTGTPEGVGPVGPNDVITAGISELGVEITVPIAAALSQ